MSMDVSRTASQKNVPAPERIPPRNQAVKNDAVQQEAGQEKVSISGQKPEVLTYGKPRAIPEDLVVMLEESNRQAQEMMDLIRQLIGEQGLNWSRVASGEQQLEVDQETIAAAQEAIGEDGEWGVKKVAERILSFAKFAIGDDPAQLQKIRDAVELGFAQAKEALGGVLPEISQKTYDTIMAEFDRWEKEGMPQGDTVSLANPESVDKQAAAK